MCTPSQKKVVIAAFLIVIHQTTYHCNCNAIIWWFIKDYDLFPHCFPKNRYIFSIYSVETSTTGEGQKLCTGKVVLPAANSFFPLLCLIFDLKVVKQNRGKILSATGRTSLPVRSLCPPPVVQAWLPASILMYYLYSCFSCRKDYKRKITQVDLKNRCLNQHAGSGKYPSENMFLVHISFLSRLSKICQK